jgi:hypothetical protein
MKTLGTTALVAATLCLALGAGAADRRESRPVGGEFTAIGLSAPVKVHVAQGSAGAVELQGDESALADLETVVEARRSRSGSGRTCSAGTTRSRSA